MAKALSNSSFPASNRSKSRSLRQKNSWDGYGAKASDSSSELNRVKYDSGIEMRAREMEKKKREGGGGYRWKDTGGYDGGRGGVRDGIRPIGHRKQLPSELISLRPAWGGTQPGCSSPRENRHIRLKMQMI